jgi:hypothetical protein
MAMLVHLTPEKNAARIRRGGISPVSRGRGGGNGLYCVPLLPSFTLTHQWGRELQSSLQQRAFVAVHFRIPDGETVSVGHFGGRDLRQTTVAQAVAMFLSLDDPRGYEIFLPRAVAKSEVHRIRSLGRPIGWRHFPNAHGRRPCSCPVCLRRGEYKAADTRRRLPVDPPGRPREEILADLQDEDQTGPALVDLLWELPGWDKGDAFRIAHLVDHPHAEVRETLATVLRTFRGRVAQELLERLRDDPDPAVREAACGD